MNQTFKDQVVLITGGASGIGAGAALAFAERGAHVVVSDFADNGGQGTVKAIKDVGGEAIAMQADVTDYDQIKNLVQQTVQHYGRLDIALNNAGIGSTMAPTAAAPLPDWDKVIAVNQTGVFYCMKEELKMMQQQGGGCIVNVSSMAGLSAMPNQIAYTASKYAVIGMSKTAALEYARYKVRVNAICPVFTNTPLVDQLRQAQEGIEQKLVHSIPLRRFGEVEDIVNGILWLCDPASNFVTGLSLPIDGGQSI